MLIDMERGDHIKYSNAEFIDCVAFRLEPITKGSYNDVDGEVVEKGIIQANVITRKLSVFI